MSEVTVNKVLPEEPDYEITLQVTHDEAKLLYEYLGKTSPISRLKAVKTVSLKGVELVTQTPEFRHFGPVVEHDGFLGRLYNALDKVFDE